MAGMISNWNRRLICDGIVIVEAEVVAGDFQPMVTWSKLDKRMNQVRSHGKALVLQDSIYVVGGQGVRYVFRYTIKACNIVS